MKLTLDPRAKTVPGNYSRTGLVLHEDLAPGESCTPEQWEKARRMEDPHYDWTGHANAMKPRGDHPEYLARAMQEELVQTWEKILREKEPMRRGP